MADGLDVAGERDPSRSPASVPTTPMAAPLMKKIRMIAPRVAPMVRRIAMSLPLSFTSMIMPEMMLNAATMMIRLRIRNITLRSTLSAVKNDALACPVDQASGAADRRGDVLAIGADAIRVLDHHLQLVGAPIELEIAGRPRAA